MAHMMMRYTRMYYNGFIRYYIEVVLHGRL